MCDFGTNNNIIMVIISKHSLSLWKKVVIIHAVDNAPPFKKEKNITSYFGIPAKLLWLNNPEEPHVYSMKQ